MKTIILTVFCIGLALAEESGLRVTKKFEIVKYDKETSEPVKGLISGAKQCGGPGKFVNLHAEVCEQDGAAVCTIPKGATGPHQMMFVPSENIKSFVAKFTITSEDGTVKKIGTYELNDVNVIGGEDYLFKFVGGAKPELEGKKFTTQLELLKGPENTLELCATADFEAKN